MDKNRKIKREGTLSLGDYTIPCYVLEDGTRVLSGRGMQSALKMIDNDNDSRSILGRYLGQESLQTFLYQGKTPGHFEKKYGEAYQYSFDDYDLDLFGKSPPPSKFNKNLKTALAFRVGGN